MRAEDSCQCSLREEKPTGPCPLPLSPFCVSVPLFVPYAVIYSLLLLCVSLSSCPVIQTELNEGIDSVVVLRRLPPSPQ